MLRVLWTYRFLLYNLFMGLYFYFFSRRVVEAMGLVQEEVAVPWLTALVFFALLAEPLGLFLKGPSIRQVYAEDGFETPSFSLPLPRFLAKALRAIGGLLFQLGIVLLPFGRLFIGLALVVIATVAYGVNVFDWEPLWALLMIVEALLSIGVIIYFLRLFTHIPDEVFDLSQASSLYMLRELAGDLLLLLFNCVAISAIWIGLAADGEQLDLLRGILMYLLVYIPSGFPHFSLHLMNVQNESPLQQVFYWLSFVGTVVVALDRGGFI